MAKKKTVKPAKQEVNNTEHSYIVTGLQLSRLFRVGHRTVQLWRRDRGLPETEMPDRFNLVTAIAWREKVIRAEYVNEKSDAIRLLKAQADERAEKALLAKLERRKTQGELIEVEQVERERVERVVAVKTALRSLGAILGTQLVGITDRVAIKDLVDAEVRQVLLRFADAKEIKK